VFTVSILYGEINT